MENEMFREHLFRDIDKRHIRPHRISVVIGIPILIGLSCHTGTIAVERVLHVHVDWLSETLQLPVSWHSNLIPSTHVIILSFKAHGTRLRILCPTEQPLTVERDDLLTILLL